MIPQKRSRIPAPSAGNFPDLQCTDREALARLDETLLWLCELEGSSNTQADRVNYLEQLLFHKFDFDAEKARKFKKLRSDRLPSFSEIKWGELVEVYPIGDSFKLLDDDDDDDDPFVVPQCFLPLSLHRKIKCEGWVKMDVNGDVGVQLTDAGLNIGQYAIEAVASLFSGRIVNKSEATLPRTPLSSGGRVEYQLYTLGGTLVVVAEFKRDALTNDHAAQLFAEMIAAAEQNEASGQRVHGMLSNMEYHYFYSYNPSTKRFTQGRSFTTAETSRIERLNRMVNVINYLFSICLDALKEYIFLSKNLSAARRDRIGTSSGNAKQVAKQVVALPTPPPLVDGSPPDRKSLPLWQQTYDLICDAQEKFQFPKEAKIDIGEINRRGEAGLTLLQQALNTLPPLSSLEKGPGPKTYGELVALIDAESVEHENELQAQWQKERSRQQ
ncbi:hypothetical protein FB451DRAFT_1186158 [Mycena latifolia]|nr:hypothetical protein FB451DRAFT_1186158 [Mycena latifolia]